MKLSRLLLVLKGIAMGAADVIPGVSGGTIAFISGIYEELIDSIKSINLEAFKKLFTVGPVAFWKHINGAFLLSLFIGIAISIISLSKLIIYLLDHQPVLIWSFFFGLIVASTYLVGLDITRWRSRVIVSLIIGTAISFYITIATPTHGPEGMFFLFVYGFIAIIAMILPGISGAFILLLLGAYSGVIGLVNGFRDGLFALDMDAVSYNLIRIIVFMSGCVIGLTSFSRVLSWMFHHHKNTTLALLTGFMVGSLNKVWPWKITTMTRVDHEGTDHEAIVPFMQDNVWPWDFHVTNEIEQTLSILPSKDPQILLASGAAVFGVVLILVLNRFAPENAS